MIFGVCSYDFGKYRNKVMQNLVIVLQMVFILETQILLNGTLEMDFLEQQVQEQRMLIAMAMGCSSIVSLQDSKLYVQLN